MLQKPNTCIGCPMYGDGRGFVPDEVAEGQSVFIFAQNPGDQEEREGRPMVGATGKVNDDKFIPLTELERGRDIGIGNSIRCRLVVNGKRTNSLPPSKALKVAQAHCNAAHLKIPESVKLVVAHGAPAWQFILGKQYLSDDDWRGFLGPVQLAGRPVMCTLHTAALFHNPRMIQAAKVDWRKIGKYVKGEWPLAVPQRVVINELDVKGYAANLKAIDDWFAAASSADYVVFDTEYVTELNKKITLIGLLYEDTDGVHGIQYPFTSSGAMAGLRGRFVDRFAALIQVVPMVGQNTVLADVDCVDRNWGIAYSGYLKLHDVMLMHHTLWAELPHSLDFLASIYSYYPNLKPLGDEKYGGLPLKAKIDYMKYLKSLGYLPHEPEEPQPHHASWLYNWGDVLVTNEALKELLQEARVSVKHLRQPTLTIIKETP